MTSKVTDVGEKARAAVMQTVIGAESQGNVYLPVKEAVQRCLSRNAYLTDEQVATAMTELAAAKSQRLYLGHSIVAMESTLLAENAVASLCAERLIENCQDTHVDWAALVSNAEAEIGVTLSASQREAAVGALSNSTSVITGGAGSGKTTLLKVICKAFDAYYRTYDNQYGILQRTLLMAPTGKAARRLAAQAALPAYTIHSVIYTSDANGSSPFYEEDGTLKAPLIIVDETSMVDVQLMYGILKGVSPKKKIIFVGDPHQLPSIGPGLVLDALMNCGFPVFNLTDNFRLSVCHNALAQNLDQIRKGSVALEYDESFRFLPGTSTKDVGDAMVQNYIHMQFMGQDVQMLSPMTKTPTCGTFSLNTKAQNLCNPLTAENPGIAMLGENFRIGDRIVQLKNNRHGRNGDTGSITAIETCDQPVVSIHFDTGNDVQYTSTEIVNERLLTHAYALTVHKAQGSEYDYIILPVISSQGYMWNQNMIYTAVSRARKGAILIGSEGILEMAVKRPLPKRYTDLLEKIRGCMKKLA
jgi:exodeoxyribonuclease V alpha subunit